MKVVAELSVKTVAEEHAEALRRVLEPDNVGLPKNMSLRVKTGRWRLDVQLEFEGSVGTILSSLDEILHDIQLSAEVLSNLR